MPTSSKRQQQYEHHEAIATPMAAALLRSLRGVLTAPDHARPARQREHVRLCNAVKVVARAIGMECG